MRFGWLLVIVFVAVLNVLVAARQAASFSHFFP